MVYGSFSRVLKADHGRYLSNGNISLRMFLNSHTFRMVWLHGHLVVVDLGQKKEAIDAGVGEAKAAGWDIHSMTATSNHLSFDQHRADAARCR
jgi:hypothetical protein